MDLSYCAIGITSAVNTFATSPPKANDEEPYMLPASETKEELRVEHKVEGPSSFPAQRENIEQPNRPTMQVDTGMKPRLTLYPRWLSLAVFVVVVGAFSACYGISVDKGFIVYPDFFLSTSIDGITAANVGSFFLSPAAFLLLLVGFVRYAQFELYQQGTYMNKLSLACLALCALAGHGVSSVQESADLNLHVAAGSIFFIFSSLYLLLILVDDVRHVNYGSKCARRSRVLIALIMIACAIGLIAVAAGGVTDDDKVATTAILEIVALGAFMTLFLVFFVEFKRLRLVVYLKQPATAETKQEPQS